MRAPDGSLLVWGCTPPDCGEPPKAIYQPFWRDVTTGLTFTGDPAAVSPDDSRIATVISEPDREQIIRQYDFATGRVVSNLPVILPAQNYAQLLGFAWTPDSKSLVIAMVPGTKEHLGGLYVVDRDAEQMPPQPTFANTGPSTRFGEPYAYADPGVLANGHVVAYEYSFPDQHDAWPGAVVDIDLATRTTRTLLGSPQVTGRVLCNARSPETQATHPCGLIIDAASMSARDNQALFTDGNGGIWLYNGQTARLRLIPSVGFGNTPAW